MGPRARERTGKAARAGAPNGGKGARTRDQSASDRGGRGLLILLVAMVVQTAHVAEHVAQTWQVFAMQVPRPDAGGLLGSAIDFPWVHLGYNLAYFLALLAAFTLMMRSSVSPAPDAWGLRLLSSASVIQGYHVVEHLVQIQQTLSTGAQRPSGLVGLVADNVVVHLALNVAVWFPAMLALHRFGPPRVFGHARRSAPV